MTGSESSRIATRAMGPLAMTLDRIRRLSRRDRRAVLSGLLVLVPALLFHLIVQPFLGELSEMHGRIERERGLLQREQSLLAEVKAYPRRLQAAEAGLLTEAPRLFAGPDLVAASAALSNYLGGKAHSSRVFLQRSETGTPAAENGVAELRVELSAVGDLEGMLSFLQALESGPKLVTIPRLVIGRAERVNPSESNDEEVLSLTATVNGYALTEDRSESP